MLANRRNAEQKKTGQGIHARHLKNEKKPYYAVTGIHRRLFNHQIADQNFRKKNSYLSHKI
jgi:hypothetical protein